ncbi:MAG TPA: transposase domain-containing protein [Kofleriaceae bacterium]|nr:transposase domain-containing protein [Kofleriaceae bacterium]
MHKLDPEAYLRDLFRVLPQWPRDRYIELAPKYWLATRARLDAAQLAAEVGWLTIPPPPTQ